MAIIVNTNVQSLMVQNSLASATSKMSTSMERMSTGLKINSAADDAAGMAVATGLNTQIRGASVAQSNAQIGSNLLTTTEGTLGTTQDNLLRMRDLTEQAMNGTYGSDAIDAIKAEVSARAQEVDRSSKNADFNGIKLFDSTGAGTDGIKIQIGGGTSDEDVITLSSSLFKNATMSALMNTGTDFDVDAAFASYDSMSDFLDNIDTALGNVTDRKTLIGASQNRLTSAVDGLKVQETNLTSAKSNIEDADIAVESSNFVKAQILQQSAASLLVQANQAPSIATSLV